MAENHKNENDDDEDDNEEDDLTDLLEQAASDSVIECPHCGQSLEPDAEKCPECGWKNPLPLNGLI